MHIVLDSGISAGCAVAVPLSLVFNHLGRGKQAEPAPETVPILAHGPTTEAAPVAH